MVRYRAALAVLMLVSLTACGVDRSPRPSVEGRVVDRDLPVFSNPTAVTNALFPASLLTQVIQLGVDGGQPLRVEVTLMPETRSVEWDGGSVEAVVVQFIAYRNRRVIEVAYDYFAQADDGSVWYFGETVDNYGGGRITNHSGAWLAGQDGPPGMIMPATPVVGDIYHPENIPGVVFEELVVLETDVTTPGPSGRVAGAIRVEEHLMDGAVEQKIFAPGYGEFRAEASNELVVVAVAAPTDARPGPMPASLVALRGAAMAAVQATATDSTAGLATVAADLRASWHGYRADAPPLLGDQLDGPISSLGAAGISGDGRGARQAAIDAQIAVLDLELQYRAPITVDLDRLAAWMHQLRLDAATSDRSAVSSDAAIASVVWARISHRYQTTGIHAAISSALERIVSAAVASDLAEAVAAAGELLGVVGRANLEEPPD